jgi:hypothetical protein
MNKYTKMYGWLFEAFGTREFTISEFKAVFPSPQHAKIIFDLIRSDYIRRISRGKYRVTPPEKFMHQIVLDSLEKEHILMNAKRKYAYCENDAVGIWTDGYYWTGFTRGYKPIHIRILKKDLRYWLEFFKSMDCEYALENENKTMFGITYILHPKKEVKIKEKDGIFVIPLKEVIEFCRANELSFRPALEYLDERYDLNLFDSYEHVH